MSENQEPLRCQFCRRDLSNNNNVKYNGNVHELNCDRNTNKNKTTFDKPKGVQSIDRFFLKNNVSFLFP